MAQWFYGEKGEQFGPVEDAEFSNLIASQRITATTMVWREGMGGWQPLSQVQGSGEIYQPALTMPYGTPVVGTSGLAITSMVLGILGLISCFVLLGIPAVICGHMALAEIAKSPLTRGGRGLAITGLVCGYLTTLMTIAVIVLFVFFFAKLAELSSH